MEIKRILNAYSSIITKNISLFLAVGFLNILFSDRGWFPDPAMARFGEVLYRVVIPLFLAYYAGQKAAQSIGQPYRNNMGGISGVLTAGCMMVYDGSISMFSVILAAAAAGYVSSWIFNRLENRFPAGFEMMGRNMITAVIGIGAGVLAVHSLLPAETMVGSYLMPVLRKMIDSRYLFLANLVIEPLKVLFLNNSVNHGILIPLGMQQLEETGSSILFLLESNPGPGLGILAAYWAARKEERSSVSVGLAGEFLGGIHELYFPYVLADFRLLAAATAGGVCGSFVFERLSVGLAGPVSPGSVFSILMMGSPGQWGKLLLGIAASALVSGGIAYAILRRGSRQETETVQEPQKQEPQTVQEPQKQEPIREETPPQEEPPMQENGQNRQEFPADIHTIYVVCDAGLGSSAMGAALLRKQLKAAEITDIQVRAASADDIPEGGDLLVCQRDFYEQRLKKHKAELPVIVCVEQLAGKASYAELVEQIKESRI